MQSVYPDLYRVDMLTEEGALHEEGGDSSDEDGNTEIIVPQPERLQVCLIIFCKDILKLNCLKVSSFSKTWYRRKVLQKQESISVYRDTSVKGRFN